MISPRWLPLLAVLAALPAAAQDFETLAPDHPVLRLVLHDAQQLRTLAHRTNDLSAALETSRLAGEARHRLAEARLARLEGRPASTYRRRRTASGSRAAPPSPLDPFLTVRIPAGQILRPTPEPTRYFYHTDPADFAEAP